MLVILSVLIFSSCSKIPVKNAEWFTDLGEAGADSFYTFEGPERELTKEEWDKEREGMLCTDSSNYANLIIAIETFCRRYKACEKDFKKNIAQFSEKIEKKRTKVKLHNLNDE